MKRTLILYIVFVDLVCWSIPAKGYEIDTTKVSTIEQPRMLDRNINVINVVCTDTIERIVIPHRIHPVIGFRDTTKTDSAARTQSSILRTISYIGKSDYVMAVTSIYEAKNYIPHGDIRSDAITEAYYGIINVQIGNYTKAAHALNRCDSLFRILGDLKLFAFHYNNLGLFFQKFGSEKSANSVLNRALSISRYLNDEESIAVSLNNLAKSENLAVEKIAYLNEAIRINKKLGRIQYLADNYNNIARQYGGLKMFEEAGKYLKMANEIANTYKLRMDLLNNYEISAQIYAVMGKYKQAYEAILAVREQSKLLSDTQSVGDIEQLIQNRILAKKNYELKLREKELSISRLSFFLIVVLALLVIVMLSSLYMNGQRRVKGYRLKQLMAEKEAEHANSEIINIATFLGSRNDLLNHLQLMLSKTSKLPEKEMQQELKKMNLYIKNLQSGNEEITFLMHKIAKINEDFVVRLSQKHPELTKNDKNIALLLRANLTTKQIAILMDCDPKSINMARYRMRQHLSIGNDINLVSYLKSL